MAAEAGRVLASIPKSALGRALIVIAAGTLVRAAVALHLPLHFDEAYYWLWARHLDWGYLDQPPMIAYLVMLATQLGNATIWIRLPSLVLGAATGYQLFLFARELFDERVGVLAAALFQVVPILWFGSMISAPEAPLYLAWVVALRLGWHALHDRPGRWAGVGFAMGLGLLSKFYMVWQGLGMALYAAFHGRPSLRRAELYGGALITAVLLLPILDWNLHHGWANIRFVLHDRPRAGLALAGFQPLWLLLPDLVFLTPAFVWAAWVMLSRAKDERFRYLLWTTVPALAAPILLAPVGMARAHWWGPACLALIIVIAACWNRLIQFMAAGNALILAGVVVLILAGRPTVPPLSFVYFLYGWDDVAERVQHELAAMTRGTIVVTDNYEIAAALGYYGRLRFPVFLAGADPAAVWPRFEDAEGANGVGVTYSAFRWNQCFGRSEEAAPERAMIYREVRVFRLYDLRAPCP